MIPDSVITVEAPRKAHFAPHERGRGIMGEARGGPSRAMAVAKRRQGDKGNFDWVLRWKRCGLVCRESSTRVG